MDECAAQVDAKTCAQETMLFQTQDSLAEWSKALAPGASPHGRGFEPHSCHFPSQSSVYLIYVYIPKGTVEKIHNPPMAHVPLSDWHACCASGNRRSVPVWTLRQASPGRAVTKFGFLPKGSLKTVWPSGLRRWFQAPVRKGVGSNPTAVISLPRAVCI